MLKPFWLKLYVHLLCVVASAAMTFEDKSELQLRRVASQAGGVQPLWQGGMGPAGPWASPILPSNVPLGESFVAPTVALSPRVRCWAEGSTGF